MALGDFFLETFGGYGDLGVLLCVFLVFFIDACLFPALPELFFILGYNHNPTTEFGVQLLLAAMLAELLGVFLLCYVVRHVKIPVRIEKIAGKYLDFLLMNSEKVLLANRITHAVPYAGAFVGLMRHWNLKKCALYLMIGCIAKYSLILMASTIFYDFFSGPMALIATMSIVFTVLITCFSYSIYKNRKQEKKGKEDESSSSK